MSQIANQQIVHVSYSHVDSKWKDRILKELRSFEPPINWEFWDDSRIEPGKLWYEEIETSLKGASAAVLLISADFLASNFINSVELPHFIEQSEKRGLRVFPILVGPCNWQEVKFIAERQILPRGAKPLSERNEKEITKEIKIIAKEIVNSLKTLNTSNETQQAPSSKQFVDAKVVESTLQTTVEDSEEPGLVSLAQWKEFNLSPTATRIMQRAIVGTARKSKTIPVSTSIVFFSIFAEGINPSDSVGTSTFLANFIQEEAPNGKKTFYDVEIAYLNARGIYIPEEDFTESVPEVGSMTSAVFDMLEKAKLFSEQTTERGQIHARQLLAVLINKIASGEKIGFQNRLEEMGISFPLLQDEFLRFVKENHSINEDIWGKFLFKTSVTQKNRITRIVNYQADDAKGEEDWLQIDDDVNAFAALIASPKVSPPLSIGLFGEWGSGKTFFMRRLQKRVGFLAKESQKLEKMQRDIPYYKRIAQIEFNAWHYVESNLWASLVEHIFDNLRVAGEEDETLIVKLQEHLLEKLNLEKIAQQQANDKVEKAQNELEDIEEEIKKVRKKLDDDNRTLQSVRAADILDTVVLSEPVENEIDSLLSELNIPRVGDATQSFIDALGEARILVERGNTLLTPLIKAKDKKKRLFWLIFCLIAAPAFGLLLILLRQSLNAQWITDGITILGGIATGLITIAAWIRKQATWISEWIGKAERAKQKIDAKIAERQAAIKKEITKIEKEFDISKAQYESALREREGAKQRVAKAEAELQSATSERLLAKFIQDRAASDDYRKHLGVLALVRDDFENLSNYIEEQNWRLAPINLTETVNPKRLAKFESLNEENKDKDIRINRIVLYIDDLDRCPPNQVVDVLQAVHLLLAFPLFVVIVGVDARWVTRSLEARYRELLHNSNDAGKVEAAGDVSESLIGAATPGDYLEKIFQIPFWLNPMDEDARERMVSGLLRGDIKITDLKTTDAAQNDTTDATRKETPLEKSASETHKTSNTASKTASTEKTSSSTKIQSNKQNLSEAENQPAQPTENLLDQPNLEILQEEYEFIAKLTPLLGRSPRALKRFVNVYRLIKAGLYEEELNSFLDSKHGLPDYQAVLFLLAVDTGAPSISEKFFQCFRKIAGKQLQESVNWVTSDSEPALADFKGDTSSDWLQIKSWLAAGKETWSSAYSLKQIRKWVPRVARYSFQSKRI